MIHLLFQLKKMPNWYWHMVISVYVWMESWHCDNEFHIVYRKSITKLFLIQWKESRFSFRESMTKQNWKLFRNLYLFWFLYNVMHRQWFKLQKLFHLDERWFLLFFRMLSINYLKMYNYCVLFLLVIKEWFTVYCFTSIFRLERNVSICTWRSYVIGILSIRSDYIDERLLYL